ncbi:hypothetical protein ACJMK2_022093 [Sinanodonta woodiana]|uniref:Uncharacterized protein n=1 Tax=Sinanodonta woodiana TaxID=1069815 RepID=A0ABD3TJ62_SINWO
MAASSIDFSDLADKYKLVPLDALRVSARRKLGLYLNLEGSFNEDVGLVTDYNGLAELVGFSYLEIKNFERQKNPTDELLEVWTTRPELNPTVGNLWKYLLELGRVDILSDCESLIYKDCENYLLFKNKFNDQSCPIQEQIVTQSTDSEPSTDHYIDETAIMTIDDVATNTRTVYDAFVCYNPEGADLEFVKSMISILEGSEHGLKLFVPWRDDLPGASQNTICAKLIESRSKKLVPILIERCNVPQILRFVTLCDYTKQDLLEWFWKRLAQALKAPLDPESCQFDRPQDLFSLNFDVSHSKPSSLWSQSSSISSLSPISSTDNSSVSDISMDYLSPEIRSYSARSSPNISPTQQRRTSSERDYPGTPPCQPKSLGSKVKGSKGGFFRNLISRSASPSKPGKTSDA